MAFHRFENFESNFLTPHLSSARGPVIEGKYMYFCLVHKAAGTGSELHYHPNELLIFPVRGKINGIVGKDRRIVPVARSRMRRHTRGIRCAQRKTATALTFI